MKKPKDILLAKHHSAQRNLDAVRESLVADLTVARSAGSFDRKNSSSSRTKPSILQSLFELIRLNPQMCSGLAAVWILVFALKIATRDESHVVAKQSPVSQERVAELKQQKLFFAELIGLRETRDAEPPKSSVPHPRSERRCETQMA